MVEALNTALVPAIKAQLPQTFRAESGLIIARVLNSTLEFEDPISAPRSLTDTNIVAKEVAGLLQITEDVANGDLAPPPRREFLKGLGAQAKAIQRTVEFLIGARLLDTLTTPRTTNGRLSSFTADLTTLTEWGGNEGYSKLAKALAIMPDNQQALVAMGIDLDLARHLGFPAAALVNEKRFAQYLKVVINHNPFLYTPELNKWNHERVYANEKITADDLRKKREDDMAILLEVLSERLDHHEINPQLLLCSLDNRGDAPYFLRRIWRYGGRDYRPLMLELINTLSSGPSASSPKLEALRRMMRQKFEDFTFRDIDEELPFDEQEEFIERREAASKINYGPQS